MIPILVLASYTQEKDGTLERVVRQLRVQWKDRARLVDSRQVHWDKVVVPYLRRHPDRYQAAAVWAVRTFERLVVVPTPQGDLSKGVATIAQAFLDADKKVYVTPRTGTGRLRVLVSLSMAPGAEDQGGWSRGWGRPVLAQA